MRLVCPNCEAKYEVPEDAIPETGRDVQCANCGHAWFQMRTHASAPESARPEVAPPPPQVPTPAGPEAVEEPVASEPEVAAVEPLAPEEVTVEPVIAAAESPVSPVEVVAEDQPSPADPTVEATAEPAAEFAAPAHAQPAAQPQAMPAAAEVALAEALAVEEVAVAEVAAKDVAAEDVAAPPSGESLAGSIAEPVMEMAPSVATDLVPEAAPEQEMKAEGAEPEAEAGPAPKAAAAYAVDESVLAILREEAEREAKARRAEARPLEMQPDLGVDAAVPASRKPAEVPGPEASVAAVLAAEQEEAEARPAARRDLLPNVEEINSTLRPSEHPVEEDEVPEAVVADPVKRSSFRSGFLLVMTITILGSVLYMGADMLSAAIPALAGPLDAFVGFVDGLRLQLDGLMRNATVAINGNGP